jgi:hypothetical protein
MPRLRELDENRTALAAAAIRPMAERLRIEEQLRPYEPYRFYKRDGRRTLHLDDLSGIPFLDGVSGIEEYQHRARARCKDGDLFVSVTDAIEGYEDYCQQSLGLGVPVHILSEPIGSRLAVAENCLEEPALSAIAAHAGNGLLIHPYMSTESVWRLAARLAEMTGAWMTVLGPPPPVTWIANDKGCFDELVEAVLGRDWLVDTARVRTPEALADALWELSTRHRKVGLKRTRCASAMGNEVHTSADLHRRGRETVLPIVRRFLSRTRWEGDEELLAVAWEETDLSPSTQLWIPPIGRGTPLLEGMYEQILHGEEKVFLGSRPAQLPEPITERLIDACLQVGAGLQALGYSGRCSFDHLVVGDRILFTECNGRWGGTSTPMSLLDRLFDPRPPYRAQDIEHPSLRGRPFADITAALGDDLWAVDNPGGRFILYNPGPLRTAGKVDVISIAETQEEAERGLTEVLPVRLGLV